MQVAISKQALQSHNTKGLQEFEVDVISGNMDDPQHEIIFVTGNNILHALAVAMEQAHHHNGFVVGIQWRD